MEIGLTWKLTCICDKNVLILKLIIKKSPISPNKFAYASLFYMGNKTKKIKLWSNIHYTIIGIIQIRIHAIKHVHSKNALSEIQVI